MTAVTGNAFEMRYTVKHLMRRHGIAPAPCVVPLTAPQRNYVKTVKTCFILAPMHFPVRPEVAH
jgi:hypothetical protein